MRNFVATAAACLALTASMASAGVGPKDVVDVASESPDHTTLVAAVKAAEYVVALKNPGPLTVFAPTNAAFALLPKGTVEDLLKPDNKVKLQDILKYHVTTSAWQMSWFKDGQSLGMANGAKTTIHLKDGQLTVNDAKVVATIPVSNGIIYVVDKVLLPPAK